MNNCAFWGNLMSLNVQKEECLCRSVNHYIFFSFFRMIENSCDERVVKFRINGFQDYCAFRGNLMSLNISKGRAYVKISIIFLFFHMIDDEGI